MNNEVEIIYECTDESIGTYDPESHTSDDCDKCGERVGFTKLRDIPFIYHDYNDHVHRDVMPPMMYHQYSVCSKCWKRGV